MPVTPIRAVQLARGSRERSFGETRMRLALFEKEPASEVSFGDERVVSRAIEREVFGSHPSATRKGFAMVNLQPLRLATLHAALIDVCATVPVALEDCASHRRRHVTTPLSR